MYGYLFLNDDGSLDAAMPQWMAKTNIKWPSDAHRKQAEDNALKAFKKACPSQDLLSKQLSEASVKQLFARFGPSDLSFAMAIWLAHHRQPEFARKARTKTLDALFQDQFGDLDPSDELGRMQNDLKDLALLVPDAMQATEIRTQSTAHLFKFLQNHTVFKKQLAQPLQAILTPLQSEPEKKLGQIKDLIWGITCSRAAGQRSEPLPQLLKLIQQGKSDLLIEALSRVMARFSGALLLPSPVFYDALCLMVAEAIRPDARSNQDIVEAHLDQADNLWESQKNQARRATMEAVAAGVDLGDKTASSQEALFQFYRNQDFQNRKRTRDCMLRARERKNATPGKLTEKQQAEAAEIQSWSLQQVAQWIEGPIAQASQKPVRIDRQAILQREQNQPLSLPKTPQPKQKSQPPDGLTPDEVDESIRQALSATANFFLGEIGDLLAPAKLLKAPLELITHCIQLQPELQAVANGQKLPSEEDVIALLGKAENEILLLRAGLKSAASTAKQQQAFRHALTTALRAEPLVLGKRQGGQIACPAQVEDWSYVNENFHNRWLPQVKAIQMNGALTLLRPNQAVALYVTGSSLSGYAFDVSVHLWLRRQGNPCKPSDEGGQLPPMNAAAWFDTLTPCCVLHVPHAQ